MIRFTSTVISLFTFILYGFCFSLPKIITLSNFWGINHGGLSMFQCFNNVNLRIADPLIYNLIDKEYLRQRNGINLIASENIASAGVLQALGSCLTNKYSEGIPFKRYYSGTCVIDQIESLCQNRALNLFQINNSSWGVNVQSYSGSTANFAIYTALMQPGQSILALNIASGGHISHGLRNAQKNLSASSIYFSTHSYHTNDKNLIDYEDLRRKAKQLKPKLIIAGASAYTRDWDYREMKAIANDVGAYLMADISHIAGFVAAGLCNNPFPYCDVVMSTTHKSLRGPRGALIFYRHPLASAVNNAVFPGTQGGPHNNNIAAIAVALHEASLTNFKEYMADVQWSAAALANLMMIEGLDIVSNGTSNHIVLWNVSRLGLRGDCVERVFDICGLYVNKNMLPGDVSALKPSGIRIGLLSITTRGLRKSDDRLKHLFLLMMRALTLTQQLDLYFRAHEMEYDASLVSATLDRVTEFNTEAKTIRTEVEDFANTFDNLPGMSTSY